MSEAERPAAVFGSVWRQRNAWAREAREAKARQEKARLLALSLAVAGAFVASLASVWGEYVSALALVSSALIGVGGYLGRELLTPERETRWARARLLAEALKRECWRYRMGVPPYDGPQPHEALSQRAEEMMRNRGLERPHVSAGEAASPAASATIAEYLEQRVYEQAAYYERSSAEQRARREKLKNLARLVGAIAVVLGLAGAWERNALAFLPAVTTATAALAAWIQGNRVGSVVPLYQETAAQLVLRAADWTDDSGERATLPRAEQKQAEARFVEECEEIMSRENGAWRAEWLSEEKAQEAAAAVWELAKPPSAARGSGQDDRRKG